MVQKLPQNLGMEHTWIEVENLSTARVVADGSGASNTSALCFGGATALTATEEWDGTGFIIETLTTTSDN